jgi:predicted acylesterase/phospholipase RssA
MKRALVLCGGGSLGSYEVGVWKYLREKGMHFDIVTGTSIGAINGAMVACDDFDKADSLWRSMAADKVMVNGMNLVGRLFGDPSMNKRIIAFAKTYVKNGGADITPLTALVKATIDPHKVKTSPITLGIVATTYPSLKEYDVVVNDLPEDKILDYLHASSACYPIFPVYKIDNRRFIDGGYNNNLPIDFAIRLGATEIVAVLLHAVPKVPQHKEMMDLPFVTVVRPSRDTGSIMDFDGKIEANNMTLGYNDALRAFHEAWGTRFTFRKDESFAGIFDEFVLRLATKHPYDFEKIRKAIQYDDIPVKNSQEFFTRTLEIVGEWINLDYLTIYTYTDFIKASVLLLKSKQKRPDAVPFSKNASFGYRLTEKERLPFLVSLYHSAQTKGKALGADSLFGLMPETAAIKELVFLLHEKGLLQAGN